MDMNTTADQMNATAKRASTPKHGKKPENRLWSKWRRGPEKRGESEGDGTINPDASIEVAAVCGSEVLIFSKSRKGMRVLMDVIDYGSHGNAAVFAAEHDANRRIARSARDTERVYAPFYQVKAGGVVTDQTNTRERAHAVLHDAAARPKELWRITEGGSAELLDRVI